jgi:signal transduction histidine kinase
MHIEKLDTHDPEYLSKITKALYANNFELETQKNRLHSILHNVSEIVFGFDDNFKISLFNKEAETVFEKKAHEVHGMDVLNFIKIIDLETNLEVDFKKNSFKDKHFYVPRVRLSVKGYENEYYKLSSTYIDIESVDKKVKEAVVILANITAEVEIDKQKDEFISIASHELKTPISITKNNLWMFKHVSKKKYSQREQRFLYEMGLGLDRLQKIVNNLLDISRIEHGKLVMNFEVVDIYKEFLKVADRFKDDTESKKLKFIVESGAAAGGPALCNVDKERFIEVLENLVGNAIKYTAKGKITFKFEENQKQYIITISDTGPGIPSKDYPKIFTKFGRASEGLKLEGATSGSSTGLGLYISKNYIENMKGKIGFTSEVGEGTNFWIKLPKHS